VMRILSARDLTETSIGDRRGRWLTAVNGKTPLYRIHQIERMIGTILNLVSPLRCGPEQKVLGERLKQELQELSNKRAQQTEYWRETYLALQRCAATGDPMYFLHWPPLARAVQDNSSPTVLAAYLSLRGSAEWREVWRPLLRHPRYGHPPAFLPYPLANPVTVQHAGHLHYFRKAMGQCFFGVDCVIDLGAGYGSMCRIAQRLGFDGSYLIFDQPPMLSLQRYFLALHGIDSSYGEGSARVSLYSDLEQLRKHLSHCRFRRIAIMSTWALSEMPLTLRAEIESVLDAGKCVMVLFAYQANFEGIDNHNYFNSFVIRHSEGWDWVQVEVPYHHPGNYYIFGARPR
jgi:hypothetical protein